jgi:hypothetical protein
MKTIKSLLLALLITLTAVFGTACEDDEKETEEPPAAGEVVCNAGEEMDDMGDVDSDVEEEAGEDDADQEPEAGTEEVVAGEEVEEPIEEAGTEEEAPAGEEDDSDQEPEAGEEMPG